MKPIGLFLLLSCGIIFAADKPRDWKIGTVISAGMEHRSETYSTQGTAPNGMPNGTTQTHGRGWNEYTYAVAGDNNLIYTMHDEIRTAVGGLVQLGKSTKLQVGDQIKYAVDRNSIYLVVDSKERKFRIANVAMRSVP